MREENILDLKNPIFAVYVDIGGMPRDRAEEKMQYLAQYFDYENIKTFIMPISDNKDRIEILWKGSDYMIPSEDLEEDLAKLRSNLLKISEIISHGITDEKIKAKLRKYLINDIMDKED